MKHEYLVLDCIHINEYVIHQHKNSMTERSRKARRVISNFTLPQPKEEGEKEHKDFLCDYLYHKRNEPKQKKKVKISFSEEIVISQQETLIGFIKAVSDRYLPCPHSSSWDVVPRCL